MKVLQSCVYLKIGQSDFFVLKKNKKEGRMGGRKGGRESERKKGREKYWDHFQKKCHLKRFQKKY